MLISPMRIAEKEQLFSVAQQYIARRYTLNDMWRALASDVVPCCLQQLVQSQDPDAEELLGAAELLTTARSYFG